jgi:Protein of unknown function (DUF1638)
MKLKLISCEILFREICTALARSPHIVDVEFMPKGLHDIAGEGMCQRLQEALDKVDEANYDAIIFGYALCGMGLAGLTARTKPVILPRGHDCITLFLGSRDRYQDYFDNNAGAYFKTTGWIERGKGLDQLGGEEFKKKFGMAQSYEELLEKYGKENADYLWEELGGYSKNYGKLTFIEMGIEPSDSFEKETREEAAERGMEFEKVRGDMVLIERLVNGDWEGDDFLVIQPGHRVVARHDERIIDTEPAT